MASKRSRGPEHRSQIKRQHNESRRDGRKSAEVVENGSNLTSAESPESEEEASETDDEPLSTTQARILRPYDRLLQSFAVDTQSEIVEFLDGYMQDQSQEQDPERARLGNGIDDDDYEEIDETGSDDESALDCVDQRVQDARASESVLTSDPFKHFQDCLDDSKIQALEQRQWTSKVRLLMPGYSCLQMVPATDQDTEDQYDFSESFIKPRLGHIYKQIFSENQLLNELARRILKYQDVLFPCRDVQNAQQLRRMVSFHALNHILKTRDTVLKNNSREHQECRDQGFTRPKVLVILPTRQSAVKYVNLLVEIFAPEQQENRQRFLDQFHAPSSVAAGRKGAEFQELFDGNDGDLFRLGIKLTRKTIKFFSQFYTSDIILASPLGLKLAIGEDSKTADSDYLSSIEIVVFDQCDALLMQNWDHVSFILQHLNLQPKAAHGCDFSRVKNWYLDQRARYVRQTICLSAYNFPALNRLFNADMLNLDGKFKFTQTHEGSMLELAILFPQTFSRFDHEVPQTEPDSRFNYFCTAVLPGLLKPIRGSSDPAKGVLIFIPGYADFVRLRNYFETELSLQHLAIGSISEYSPPKEASRMRSHFATGRIQFLLYTERMHHFHRSTFAGSRSIVMYGLPENPKSYVEVIDGFLGVEARKGLFEPKQASIRVLFSRLDALKLERVVGSSRTSALLKAGSGDTFRFA